MYDFPGAAYDRWLEAPYVEAAQREADFENWCEREGVDPDDADAYDRFERWVEDQYDDEPDWD